MKRILYEAMSWALLAAFLFCMVGWGAKVFAGEKYEKHIVCFYEGLIVFDERIPLGRRVNKQTTRVMMIEHDNEGAVLLGECYVDILRDGIPTAFDPRN